MHSSDSKCPVFCLFRFRLRWCSIVQGTWRSYHPYWQNMLGAFMIFLNYSTCALPTTARTKTQLKSETKTADQVRFTSAFIAVPLLVFLFVWLFVFLFLSTSNAGTSTPSTPLHAITQNAPYETHNAEFDSVALVVRLIMCNILQAENAYKFVWFLS